MKISLLKEAIRTHLKTTFSDADVRMLKGDIRAFHPVGDTTLLVQYRGSSFGNPRPTQRRRYKVIVYLGVRELEDETTDTDELLDALRTTLTGWRFPELGDGDGMMYPTIEDWLFTDTDTSYVWYYIQFEAFGEWHKNATA